MFSCLAPNSYACGHLEESGQPYLWGTRATGLGTRSGGVLGYSSASDGNLKMTPRPSSPQPHHYTDTV